MSVEIGNEEAKHWRSRVWKTPNRDVCGKLVQLWEINLCRKGAMYFKIDHKPVWFEENLKINVVPVLWGGNSRARIVYGSRSESRDLEQASRMHYEPARSSPFHKELEKLDAFQFGPSHPNRTVQINFKGRFTVRLNLLLGFRIHKRWEFKCLYFFFCVFIVFLFLKLLII